jgi:drug/metabolite transporter (DMT)-like permease
LLAGFAWNFYKAPKELRQRWFQLKTLSILAFSGTSLALHFGAWIWSLEHTSLEHSLLFVTGHPLVIVFGEFVLWLLGYLPSRPSIGEFVGSVVGFAALGITLLDVKDKDTNVTFVGGTRRNKIHILFFFFFLFSHSEQNCCPTDAVAFLGAIAIIGYLYCGKNLRSWMPLFMYAFPVTLLSSVLLGMAALVDGASLRSVVFGYFSDWEWTLYVLYVGFVPGILGHTAINYVIKHVSPLVVSVTLLMEPIIGSFIGYFVGVSTLPGVCNDEFIFLFFFCTFLFLTLPLSSIEKGTFIGAPTLVISLSVVVISSARRLNQKTQPPVEEVELLET